MRCFEISSAEEILEFLEYSQSSGDAETYSSVSNLEDVCLHVTALPSSFAHFSS